MVLLFSNHVIFNIYQGCHAGSLFACSARRFYIPRGFHPLPPMVKINQFHLVVVSFLLSLFFFHFPLLPLWAPFHNAIWQLREGQSNDLQFQLLTKDARVSKRLMNVGDTYMYREVPPVLSGRTKEKPDKPDIALEQRKAAVLLSVVHRTPIHLPSHPLSPNTPLGPCQNPISSINDMWFKEKACGRTRKTQDQPSYLFVFYTCITRQKYYSRGRVILAT